MNIFARALPALLCVPTLAQAGNFGLQFAEPTVTNFRTVATALWQEQSTVYVGITGSRQHTNLPGSFSTSVLSQPYSFPFPTGNSGVTPGLLIGARRMAHGFVVGAEFSVNAAADPATTSLVFGGPIGAGLPVIEPTTFTHRARISSDMGLRFVAGREMDGLRLYGALGVSAATVTTELQSSAADFPGPHSRNMIGTHWALGAEVQATERTSIRFEYNQTNYGAMNYNVSNGPNPGDRSTHRVSAATRRLTVGAIFEF